MRLRVAGLKRVVKRDFARDGSQDYRSALGLEGIARVVEDYEAQ
jgi:hypothetical protein